MRFIGTIRFWAFRVAVLSVLLIHATLTLIYCFPSNPVKVAMWPILEATIGTYFPQTWLLFAPDPIQMNQSVLVNCSSAPWPAGTELPSDGWQDITTPLIERHHANRFSAYERLSRSGTNLVREWLRGSPGAAELHRECDAGDSEACAAEERAVAEERKSIAPHLRTLASSFCHETRPNGGVTHVAIRLRQTNVLPWSKRHDSVLPAPIDRDLGTFAIDEEVIPSGLYSPEE